MLDWEQLKGSMRWFKLVAAFNILKLEHWNLNECRIPGSDRCRQKYVCILHAARERKNVGSIELIVFNRN